MADKKKINITVKKTVSPFLFPETTPSVPSVSFTNLLSSASSNTNPSSVSSNSDSLGTTIGAAPEKRKRGRPRLNKDQPPKPKETKSSLKIEKEITSQKSEKIQVASESQQEQDPDLEQDLGSSNNDTEGTTETATNSSTSTKKRGRKPKNQNLSNLSGANDRVYSLFSTKTALDLENLENLSYIIDLKLTKEKVEECILEMEREDLEEKERLENAKNINERMTGDQVAVSEKTDDSLEIPKTRCVSCANCPTCMGSFSSFSGMGSLSTMDLVEPVEPVSQAEAGRLFNTKTRLPLEEYEHVEINVNANQSYLDCYTCDLMPGFIAKELIPDCREQPKEFFKEREVEREKDPNELVEMKEVDRWPTSSKYPCRNCDEYFSTTPAGLVQKVFGDFEMDPMRCKFFLYLNFCNWACAARYAFDRIPDWVNQHNLMNLCYNTVMKKIDPKHKWRKVEMAPELGNLQRNGGELTIEEYRDISNTNITLSIYLAPLIPLRMTLEETTSIVTNTRMSKNGRNNTTTMKLGHGQGPSSANISLTNSNGSDNSGRRNSPKDKSLTLDKSRILKAEQSIKNRKEGARGNTIDRLMKVEIRS